MTEPIRYFDLACRALDSGKWVWLAGTRYAWFSPASQSWHYGRVLDASWAPNVPDGLRALPDFSDTATAGCLPALVREAWRDPSLYVQPRMARGDDGGLGVVWVVSSLRSMGSLLTPGRGSGYAGTGEDEVTAWVAALGSTP